MNIIFLTIRNTQEKLSKLCAIAHRYFEAKTPLLFMTSDDKAREFLDDLLWKMPIDSFLPHTATNMPCKDLIAVTSARQNVNEARTIFNLTSDPLITELQATTIYEFDESASTLRRKISEERFNVYRQKGYAISTET